MKAGDLVRYSEKPNDYIGIIIKKDIGEGYTFYHVYWPAECTSSWVTRHELEIVLKHSD